VDLVVGGSSMRLKPWYCCGIMISIGGTIVLSMVSWYPLVVSYCCRWYHGRWMVFGGLPILSAANPSAANCRVQTVVCTYMYSTVGGSLDTQKMNASIANYLINYCWIIQHQANQNVIQETLLEFATDACPEVRLRIRSHMCIRWDATFTFFFHDREASLGRSVMSISRISTVITSPLLQPPSTSSRGSMLREPTCFWQPSHS
jgi:hypothetical protein